MKASTTRDLLLHLLQPADPSSSLCREITPAQWHALITLAHQQRVTALLYQRINDHGLTSLLPTDVQTTLQKSYRTNALRNLKLYHQLIELLKALQAAEIPVIVLKGSYLGQAVYSHPALRFMVDFDLMVPEEALEATLEILATLGYRPLTPVILENSKALGHHLPRFVKEQSVASVEIHWTITRPNQAYTIAMDELWERAQPFTLPGVTALAFSHEDFLLHLCLHATYQHRFLQGVRPLFDISETVSRYGECIDWHAFCQRAQRWGWDRGVYLALYLAKVLLDAAIPEAVLTTLRPSAPTPHLVESAQSQIFAAYSRLETETSGHFMQAMGEQSLAIRLKLLWSRTVLSRQELAYAYNLPINSPRLPLYYAVRLWDLLLRYRKQVGLTLRSDPTFTHAKQQRNDFVQWLEQG